MDDQAAGPPRVGHLVQDLLTGGHQRDAGDRADPLGFGLLDDPLLARQPRGVQSAGSSTLLALSLGSTALGVVAAAGWRIVVVRVVVSERELGAKDRELIGVGGEPDATVAGELADLRLECEILFLQLGDRRLKTIDDGCVRLGLLGDLHLQGGNDVGERGALRVGRHVDIIARRARASSGARKEFNNYPALLRDQRRGVMRSASKPRSSSINRCSSYSMLVPALDSPGHAKVPRSSRLASTH